MLDDHGLPSSFNGTPNEIQGAIPFAEDNAPRDYSREFGGDVSGKRLGRSSRYSGVSARAFRARQARSSVVGKLRPRGQSFFGREAPPHPGGMAGLPDRVAREAYSHEVASAGFWAAGAAEAERLFLQLHLSRAGRISEGERPSWPLRRKLWRVCPSLRRSPSVGRSSANVGGILSILPTKPAPTSRGGIAPRSSANRWRPKD